MSYNQQTTTKPVARGYCRVSTIMQSEQGISLETQRSRIADLCKFKGYDLKEYYTIRGINYYH